MKVKDAIAHLSQLPGDSEIIIAWWDYECFLTDMSLDKFNKYAERVNNDYDWSDVRYNLGQFLEEFPDD